jgi:large subunit ribosomal protein L6
MPVPVPQNVRVTIEGSKVIVEGPKGRLTREFHPDMEIALEDGHLIVRRPTDNRFHKSLHGLTRALLANMVTGVSEGFRKTLEIEGTGYRAELQGDTLVLSVGYSHPVKIEPPPGIKFTIERGAKIVHVDGIDKELVGQVAAEVRAVRKPEPYKGKGIRYAGEWIRRKAGKAGKVGA